MKSINIRDVFIFGAGALIGGLLGPYIMFATGELIGYTQAKALASTSTNVVSDTVSVKQCAQQGGNRNCCKLGANGDRVGVDVVHNCILCNHPDCTNKDVDMTFHPII